MVGDADASSVALDLDPLVLFRVAVILWVHAITSCANKTEWEPIQPVRADSECQSRCSGPRPPCPPAGSIIRCSFSEMAQAIRWLRSRPADHRDELRTLRAQYCGSASRSRPSAAQHPVASELPGPRGP